MLSKGLGTVVQICTSFDLFRCKMYDILNYIYAQITTVS